MDRSVETFNARHSELVEESSGVAPTPSSIIARQALMVLLEGERPSLAPSISTASIIGVSSIVQFMPTVQTVPNLVTYL